MPLAHLPTVIDEHVENAVITSVEFSKFRDFLTIALVVDERYSFPDNWILYSRS